MLLLPGHINSCQLLGASGRCASGLTSPLDNDTWLLRYVELPAFWQWFVFIRSSPISMQA